MPNKMLTPDEISERILASINDCAESAGVPPEEILKAFAKSWYVSSLTTGGLISPPIKLTDQEAEDFRAFLNVILR